MGKTILTSLFIALVASTTQAAPSLSLDAGTPAGWDLNNPNVLYQTIYGTQRDINDNIIANRQGQAMTKLRGGGFAFEVTEATILDTLTLKFFNLVDESPDNQIEIKMWDVTNAPVSYLKTGVAPSRADPGSGGAQLLDLTITHAAAPFHLEPIINNTTKYTDLIVDFDDMAVDPGIYFITFSHEEGGGNTNGSITGGNNTTDNNHMIFFGNGDPIPNPTIPTNSTTLGNFRWYLLSNTTTTSYTGQNDRRLVMQLLTVPEPSTVGLLACGALMMLRRGRNA